MCARLVIPSAVPMFIILMINNFSSHQESALWKLTILPCSWLQSLNPRDVVSVVTIEGNWYFHLLFICYVIVLFQLCNNNKNKQKHSARYFGEENDNMFTASSWQSIEFRCSDISLKTCHKEFHQAIYYGERASRNVWGRKRKEFQSHKRSVKISLPVAPAKTKPT